jgi:hypothetical protein
VVVFSHQLRHHGAVAGQRSRPADLARNRQPFGRIAGFGGRPADAGADKCRPGDTRAHRTGAGPALSRHQSVRLFRQGRVFAAKPIIHIRAAGLWTIIWAFAPSAAQLILEGHVRMKFEPALLAFGIATFIAAHVMAEAQRIADENASIL